MPQQQFANNAKSTLSVAVSSSGQATLTVQTGHGARFPSPLNPDFFYVTLDDGSNVEICKCISRSGDVLTVLRGVEGTAAQASFAITTTKVELRITEDTLDGLSDSQNFTPSWIRARIGVSSWDALGMPAPTMVGSALTQTLNNSSWPGGESRNRITVGNSAQFKVELLTPFPVLSGQKGFRFYTRFGVWNAPNSSHWFLGLVNTTGTVSSVHPPSSLTNAIVIGMTGSGSPGNLSIWRNGPSGNAVQLDLGSLFTANTLAWYEFNVEVAPGDTNWYYNVRRLDINSVATVSSFFTTSVPANSLWLSPMLHAASMVTSGIAIDLQGWVAE